jgi:hypothetical protein
MKINKKFEFTVNQYELAEYFQEQVEKFQDKGFVVTSLVLHPETMRTIMNNYYEQAGKMAVGYSFLKGGFEEIVFMHTIGDPTMEKDEFRLVVEPLES